MLNVVSCHCYWYCISIWPNLLVYFSKTWHANRWQPTLQHGIKNLENGYMITRKTKFGIWTRKTFGPTNLELVYIQNFTWGVAWAGSHLATHLPCVRVKLKLHIAGTLSAHDVKAFNLQMHIIGTEYFGFDMNLF